MLKNNRPLSFARTASFSVCRKMAFVSKSVYKSYNMLLILRTRPLCPPTVVSSSFLIGCRRPASCGLAGGGGESSVEAVNVNWASDPGGQGQEGTVHVYNRGYTSPSMRIFISMSQHQSTSKHHALDLRFVLYVLEAGWHSRSILTESGFS